jgi:hypothetical protein
LDEQKNRFTFHPVDRVPDSDGVMKVTGETHYSDNTKEIKKYSLCGWGIGASSFLKDPSITYLSINLNSRW